LGNPKPSHLYAGVLPESNFLGMGGNDAELLNRDAGSNQGGFVGSTTTLIPQRWLKACDEPATVGEGRPAAGDSVESSTDRDVLS
jgi:hypothetical protein